MPINTHLVYGLQQQHPTVIQWYTQSTGHFWSQQAAYWLFRGVGNLCHYLTISMFQLYCRDILQRQCRQLAKMLTSTTSSVAFMHVCIPAYGPQQGDVKSRQH